MLLSTNGVCDSKISQFIKQQETNGLISSLGAKTPLSKIPLVCFILGVLTTQYKV